MAAALAKSQAAAEAAIAAAQAATAQLQALQAAAGQAPAAPAGQAAPAAGSLTPGPSQHASVDSPPSAVRHLRGRLQGLRRAQVVDRTAAREAEIGELEFELEERERKFRKYGHWSL